MNLTQTATAIQEKLIAHFSRRLGLAPHEIDIHRPFAEYGLSSIESVNLMRELEEWLGYELSPALPWKYPTIDQLTNYLTQLSSAPSPEIRSDASHESIAIIGMSCRFPGANSPQAFWNVLAHGIDAITETPPDRWDVDLYYDPNPDAKGKIVGRWGGYLDQLDHFDAAFFGISPREAAQLDPRQRLMLELAWEALEDAGIPPDSLSGSQTGVFVATLRDDYGARIFDDFDIIEIYSGTGTANAPIPNRISYFLNARGPSLALDTACSGSLVAIHLACQSLCSGESTLALAGGVNVILEPDSDIFFSRAGALSPDGRCKTFDSRANGIVRAEGAGLVVLKRLSQALADGDHIYAIIRGSAVNHDGRSNGLMAPNGEAQEAVLREAYRRAGINPAQVQYIEAHGTGTPLGDPIEVNALGAVLAPGRDERQTCVLGSLKTNVGHAEAAAGIAGVIKVALAMQHRQIPPNLHFQQPNPLIPFDKLPFVVPQSLMAWPRPDEPLIAGVSGFGFAGANAHVVLEAPPSPPPQHEAPALPRLCLLPLSAKTPEALRDIVAAYRDALTNEAEALCLYDVCGAAGLKRTHFEHRLAVVCSSQQEAANCLDAFSRGESHTRLISGKALRALRRLVFVFSGQGSHWFRMGCGLMHHEPVFRNTLEECDRMLADMAGWSLLEELQADEARSRLNSTDVTQPAIFAIQVSLAALWRSWGITPDIVIGHSLGEAAAAYVAGALSLQDALRVVYHRSRLMKRVEGRGKTAVVGLSPDQARLAVAGVSDAVSVAGSNSPVASVLSGDPDALERLLRALESQGVFCRVVPGVNIAFHSVQMEPLKDELARALQPIRPRAGDVPILSTVTGALIDGEQLDASYWGRNLREPFLFAEGIRQLVQSGYDTFLEISPHPVLGMPIMQGLEALNKEGLVLPSLRRNEPELETLLLSLGNLYVNGYPVRWSALYPNALPVAQRLPKYAWQREHYWHDQLTDKPLGASAQLKAGSAGAPKRAGRHPLLGEHVQVAAGQQHIWEMDMDARVTPYMPDHRVWGAVVMPGAAFVEMALAVAAQAFGTGTYAIERVHFKQALYLPEHGKQRVQVALTPDMPGNAAFQVFSPDPERDGWKEHVSATIRALSDVEPPQSASPTEIRARCHEQIDGTEHYRSVHTGNVLYGPSFQAVQKIWRRDGEALGLLELPAHLASESAFYGLHPVLLDAAFQTSALTSPYTSADQLATGETFLPVSVKSVRVYRRGGARAWCHAALNFAVKDGNIRETDITLFDEDGQIIARLEKFRVVNITTGQQDIARWLYDIHWIARSLEMAEVSHRQPETWLVFTNDADREPLAALERCILVETGQAYRASPDGKRYQIDPAAPQDYERLLREALPIDRPPCRGIVYCWANRLTVSDTMTIEALEEAQALGPIAVLYLVQALLAAHLTVKPRLWIITQGVAAIAPEDAPAIAQSMVWGIARAIVEEQPEMRCSVIDTSAQPGEREWAAVIAELTARQPEDQIALRNGTRYIARLRRYAPATAAAEQLPTVSAEAPFRLHITTPGDLESLKARAAPRCAPGPGEVEIEVYAAGLNFKDVMLATGLLPAPDESTPLGLECAGRIVAVGEGVERYRAGDAVIAAAHHCLSRYVIADARCVGPMPDRLSFEQSATLLVAFSTAHYALNHLARLKAGERVLIHAATGAVGQAAIQLARMAGAEIFATAGSPEKRAYLREHLGIEHVFDSRRLDFADEILALTDNEGVDVVLNTLPGAGISQGLSALQPYGRFVELGVRDIEENRPLRLGLLRRNISFFAVDLSRMVRERPEHVRDLMMELWPLFEDERLTPIPHQMYPIVQAEEAFRTMAHARHIGKLVIAIRGQEVRIFPPLRQSIPIRSDATYLVTGGLGGLGSAVARWLADKGARSLVLVGRRGSDDILPEAAEAIRTMEAQGAQVIVAKGDVSQCEDVAHLLDRMAALPPLRGVIHAAGVTDDTVIPRMTLAQMNKVMAPKVQGAWNLHVLTRHAPLDFFVLFSSIASIAASSGQANYASGNAFIDALAHYRRAQGLPAMVINWGPWADIGMLKPYPWLVEQIAARGFLPIRPHQGLAALDYLFEHSATQVTVLSIDWPRFVKTWLKDYEPRVFLDLYETEVRSTLEAGPDMSFVQEVLLPAPPIERLRLLQAHIQKLAAESLRLDPSRLDVHQPLNALGIDSIMALELRSKIKLTLGAPISVADLLRGLSVAAIAEQLLPQLAPVDAEVAGLLAEVEQLSDQEIEALLKET